MCRSPPGVWKTSQTSNGKEGSEPDMCAAFPSQEAVLRRVPIRPYEDPYHNTWTNAALRYLSLCVPTTVAIGFLESRGLGVAI